MRQADEQTARPLTGTFPAAPGARRQARAGLVNLVLVIVAVPLSLRFVTPNLWEDLTRPDAGDWPFFAAMLLMALILLASPILNSLRARNAKLKITRDGVTVSDWRGRKTMVFWNEVARVRQGMSSRDVLLMVDRHAEGAHPVQLAHGEADEVEDLRRAVVQHLGFEEVEPKAGFWVVRTWRWWEGDA